MFCLINSTFIFADEDEMVPTEDKGKRQKLSKLVSEMLFLFIKNEKLTGRAGRYKNIAVDRASRKNMGVAEVEEDHKCWR